MIKAVALLTGWTMLASAGQGSAVPVVPIPLKARLTEGAAYQITSSAMIVCDGDAGEIKVVADRAVEALRRVTGWSLKIIPGAGSEGNIVLRFDRGLFPGLPDWQRDEGYRLSASASRVEVSARTAHGLFNGVQTLAQLVTQSNAGPRQIPACAIEDYPRFQWRGLLLGPARHFLPPEFLKKFVDVMACYTYNRLQLHLTDDQGWRLEIKKYPRLTQIGSVRKESPRHGDRENGDGTVYGPFFHTQEQIRDLVAYAQAGHDVIMSPTSHCYFDHAQAQGPTEPECISDHISEFLPLEKVYSYEPMPAVLLESRRQHILGAQGNPWGEYLWHGKDVEYFGYPRALALAEVLWSRAGRRSLASFLVRLEGQLAQLDRLRVNYRKSDAKPVRGAAAKNRGP